MIWISFMLYALMVASKEITTSWGTMTRCPCVMANGRRGQFLPLSSMVILLVLLTLKVLNASVWNVLYRNFLKINIVFGQPWVDAEIGLTIKWHDVKKSFSISTFQHFQKCRINYFNIPNDEMSYLAPYCLFYLYSG